MIRPVFVCVWIASLGAPVLLGVLVLHDARVYASWLALYLTVVSALWWTRPSAPSRGLRWMVHNRHLASYDRGARVTFEEGERDAQRPVLYSHHPHGVFAFGFCLLFTHPYFVATRFCFSSLLYASSLLTWCLTWIGRPSPCDKRTMEALMSRRVDVALVPGGFREASSTRRGVDACFVPKGFIKLAIRHGYDICVCVAIGETDQYRTAIWSGRLARRLNRWGIPTFVFWGASVPIAPLATEMHVVVGAPLRVDRCEHPTDAMIDALHTRYIAKLTALHAANANPARFRLL